MASQLPGWLAWALVAVIAFLMLAVWQYGITFPKVQKLVNDTKEYIPNVTLGLDTVKATEPGVPAVHEKALRDLADAMQRMLQSGRKNCFERYSGLPLDRDYGTHGGLPELGEDGVVVELSRDNFIVKTRGGNQQVIPLSREFSRKVQGFTPCAIAGQYEVRNFERTFLNDLPRSTKYLTIQPNHYRPVSFIMLRDDGGNVIQYDGQQSDLEDGGMLYTPDNAHICFFPTNDAVTNEKGLNDDFLGEDPLDEFSLPRQLQDGGILPCSGEIPVSQKETGEGTPLSPVGGERPLPGGVAPPEEAPEPSGGVSG